MDDSLNLVKFIRKGYIGRNSLVVYWYFDSCGLSSIWELRSHIKVLLMMAPKKKKGERERERIVLAYLLHVFIS